MNGEFNQISTNLWNAEFESDGLNVQELCEP